MEKYGIESSILTMLMMQRQNLITKEKTKLYYEEKIPNSSRMQKGRLEDFKLYEGSINDDLETFVTTLRNKQDKEELVWSFFTPKLTKKELKLVEVGDKEHLKTYWKMNPDVNLEEMKKTNSKDKYVKVECRRATMHLAITLPFKEQLKNQLKKMKIEFDDSE